MTAPSSRLFDGGESKDWSFQLNHVVETMRDMSRQPDAQEMVRAYASRIRELMPMDRSLSVSRRNLDAPRYRITRSDLWKTPVNPWTQPERLPLLEGGAIADWIYSDRPQWIENFHVSDDDPAAEYLQGMRSIMAVPHYDGGIGLNMVVHMRREPNAFQRDRFPEFVMLSNLFGRATHNLLLSQKLKDAYDAVDREMQIVAGMQLMLLPQTFPAIPTLDIAGSYQTSQRAGGDYYDFFPLPEGQWGILIADVSGHGTPAAVIMAITHSIAHGHPGPPTPPAKMLQFVNDRLVARYTGDTGVFVTAFYGIYDPRSRQLTYSSAGHNPPRLHRSRDGGIESLNGARHFPLGIVADTEYEQATLTLDPGDMLLFYTDGITERFNSRREMFGVERLDAVLREHSDSPGTLIDAIRQRLHHFADALPAADDQTLLAMKVTPAP